MGTRGAAGAQGAAGTQGSRGISPVGTRGAAGAQGDAGVNGSQGDAGIAGAQGALGAQGSAGLRGSTGTAGVVGQNGSLVSLQAVSGLSSSHSGRTNSIYIIGKDSQTDGWNGNFYVSRSYFIDNVLYEGSDERWKTFENDIEIDFDKLSKIPKKYFRWNDMPQRLQIGTSAQKVKEIIPEAVHEDKSGFMSVSYEKLSIIALAAIDKLYDRIKSLEEKIGNNG